MVLARQTSCDLGLFAPSRGLSPPPLPPPPPPTIPGSQAKVCDSATRKSVQEGNLLDPNLTRGRRFACFSREPTYATGLVRRPRPAILHRSTDHGARGPPRAPFQDTFVPESGVCKPLVTKSGSFFFLPLLITWASRAGKASRRGERGLFSAATGVGIEGGKVLTGPCEFVSRGRGRSGNTLG
jgi:hypothetical protein